VCPERGPLSLVRVIEELLQWKSSGSGLKNRDLTAVGIRCADHSTPLYPQKLALTSLTSGGRSVGIVRLRTKSHGVGWKLRPLTGFRSRDDVLQVLKVMIICPWNCCPI
jgi:hypothetical protein